MRYSEIISEADSQDSSPLKAINTQLDILKKRLHDLGADSPLKDTLRRQKKKLQLDKSRLQVQAREKELQEAK